MRFVGISIAVAGTLALSGSAWANAGGPQPLSISDNDIDGPIQLIVSVPDQRVDVYVDGKLIANSPVSTGRDGHPTPTGVFSILQKKKFHRSNIYSQAPMPFMQRLTWSGIALHASDDVPDRPASHGCVRLPAKFAKQLFGLTEVGGHVIISGGATTPIEIRHPNLFQPVPVDRQTATGPGVASDGPKTRSANAAEVPPEMVISAAAASAKVSPPLVAEAKAEPTPAKPRSLSPVRILVTRRTGRELVRDVQTLLKDLGFDPGDLDGWMGRNTGAAITRFQESRGLPKTGAMSDELVMDLYRAAGRGKPLAGHLYVRQDFKPVFDIPIVINEPEAPLGDHLFTALDFEANATEARWLAVSLSEPATGAPTAEPEAVGTKAPATAKEALDRIKISATARRRISAMLTPGSSLAISDHGISRETFDKATDFVVLTQ